MDNSEVTRRRFLATSGAAVLAGGEVARGAFAKSAGKLALLGGEPAHKGGWPGWPVWDPNDEQSVLDVLRSGTWCRLAGNTVSTFEKKYAELLGVKRCLCTVNGTNALLTALNTLDIGVGDEVITSPYTFIATYNVILDSCALPVFADTDPETFQLDPDTIESRITENTRAILPVHILGLPADMDRINAIAKKHNLVVIEDACQAWLAEWGGKKVGTLGDLGCFSFQNSKHLTCGEGGAVVSNNEKLMDRAYSIHNCGRPHGTLQGETEYPITGTNRRLTEIQAAILLGQMKRLVADTKRRNENARYLTSKLQGIPGIVPHKLYPKVTQAAYHLYPLRYKKEEFNNVPREKFLEALAAEGVPAADGYGPQYRWESLKVTLASKNFTRAFPAERLKRYWDELNLPKNDQLCQEAVWFGQNMLLGEKSDMDDIANAIVKIHENRDKLG
jgi:dTDP-4-amino-4,6-dideoxygalactose transaminase